MSINSIDKEILNSFVEESKGLLVELHEIVDRLEITKGEFPSALLADFSQKIDRVMGAAKTMGMAAPDHIGLQRIGKLAEVCKILGYKATESHAIQAIPLFAAFWGDTIEVTDDLLSAIEDPVKTEKIAKTFPPILQRRLEWLASKLIPNQKTETTKSQIDDVKDLLKSLGM